MPSLLKLLIRGLLKAEMELSGVIKTASKTSGKSQLAYRFTIVRGWVALASIDAHHIGNFS